MKSIKEGDKAPVFKELTAHKGQNRRALFLSKGQHPGCTVEACEFRDATKS